MTLRTGLLWIALAACKHDKPVPHETQHTPAARLAPMPPANPEAVKRAREQFTPAPALDRTGTCSLFLRGDLTPAPAPGDVGDFIGRLRTLFGPTADNEYTLRDNATGLVIVASFDPSGPGFYGHKDPDGGAHARIAADPMLANGPPSDPGQFAAYQLHDEIALAGPALTAVATNLDALIASVPPADWDLTAYFESKAGVFHVGAAHGRSFEEELPPAQGLHFLLDHMDRRYTPANADAIVLNYYLEHAGELVDDRPRVIEVYRRLVAARPDAAETASGAAWRRALGLR